MAKRKTKTYPTPWVNVPRCGSYRELAAGTYQLSFRAYVGATKSTRNVSWSLAEVLDFLANLGANRQRATLGRPTFIDWPEARDVYRRRVLQKGNTDAYVEQVLALLEDLRDRAGVRLTAVQPHHVQAWLDGLEGSGRTVNKKRAMVAAFFRKLRRLRLLPADPTEPTEPRKHVPTPRRTPAPAEYLAAWDAAESSFRDLLDFLLLTGCRFGEAAKMRRIAVSGAGVWDLGPRKAGVPLRKQLDPEALALVLRQPVRPDNLVWHRWTAAYPGSHQAARFKAGAPVTVFWFNDVLEACCKAAGIPPFTAHGLRHAHVSWSVARGVSLRHVQLSVGHRNLATTAGYDHTEQSLGVQVVYEALKAARQQARNQLSS
ncbi:MAG: tyrosine-type recombinase/integrase [Planctomycetota bacterium]|nr:tyrosine-type recombinase/integrase [Planctomycetota bacterium]